HAQPEDIQEFVHKLLKDLQIIREELAKYINSSSLNRPAFYDDDDDDDDEYTIQYREYLENSVEKLVPIPSESEGISNDTCDVPFCDNSPPLDVLNDHFKIFSDFNNDCTSSDDDSFKDIDYVEASPLDFELVSLEEVKDDILHEKLLNINLLIACDLPSSNDFSPISILEEKSDVLKDVKIYSNPLFEFDDEYISSDVNPLFDEVLEDIECNDSYDFNLDESTFLVTPLSDSNEDECLTPVDEIKFLPHPDPSISIVSILEGFTDKPPLEENDDLF
ncbi:hypothetical protein Tco_1545181, partial [Tanacetum coccineum]